MIYYEDNPQSMHDYLRSLANRELFVANYEYIKLKHKRDKTDEFMKELNRLLRETSN